MIRGIDSQVMTSRTIDYSRQMSNQMQEHENSKEFASKLQQSKVELENQSVNQAKEAQDRRISREKNEQDDGKDRRRKRPRRSAAFAEDTDAGTAEVSAEEQAMSRVPRVLPRGERMVGGSIDINV